jgi:hypothetical protein
MTPEQARPVGALGSWNTTESRSGEALWVRSWLVTGEKST